MMFRTTRRAAAARLRRVNAALARWDEYDAAAAMPAVSGRRSSAPR
jgi:hypothetical protein